jgi:hypothetical protein
LRVLLKYYRNRAKRSRNQACRGKISGFFSCLAARIRALCAIYDAVLQSLSGRFLEIHSTELAALRFADEKQQLVGGAFVQEALGVVTQHRKFAQASKGQSGMERYSCYIRLEKEEPSRARGYGRGEG